MEGVVARVLADKGFGFVKGADDGVERFFHRSSVRSGFENLREGDRVTFDEARGDKGPRAENVSAAR